LALVTKTKNRYQKLKDRIEKQKDLHIKAELRKGNIAEIIEDSLNY
jgi:hypothetical protein